jgi:uncharacterized protein
MLLKFLSSALATRLQGRTRTIAVSSTLASILAAAGCGQLSQKERELTFRVEPGTASWYSGLPGGVLESSLPVEVDGRTQNIHAWWWPAQRKDAPALLYLHGARWNLTGHLFRIRQLREFGFSVLAIDYRGFGKSDGDYPSEATVYEDARVAWAHLASLQPDAGKRFIYGHSLGGAVAVDLAAYLAEHAAKGTSNEKVSFAKAGKKEKPDKADKEDKPNKADSAVEAPPAATGLIVESSFSSLPDIARALTYPWLPVQLLMSQKFDSADKIRRVDVPVLIVHGADDRYVPSRLSESLYAAAPARKKLLVVPGASHNNAMRVGADEYRAAFAELFGRQLD